jgi:hypothetical protein
LAGSRGVGLLQSAQICAKHRFFDGQILKAFQVLGEERIGLLGDAINAPVGPPFALDQSVLLEVAQMLGHLHLWFLKDLLQMTHAEWAIAKEVQDPQTGNIAETFVNGDGKHELCIPSKEYSVKGMF